MTIREVESSDGTPIVYRVTGDPAAAPDIDAIPARGVFCDKPFRENKVTSAIRGFAA